MKKLLESIRRSFSAQLSIWVVLFAAMIFISALGFVAIQSRGLVRQEAIKGADQILDKTVIRMRDILHDVEIAADNLVQRTGK
jgi:sigma-B regulation protein RsbU (phosphoserine phosphatase)